jgi:hypothetical protein
MGVVTLGQLSEWIEFTIGALIDEETRNVACDLMLFPRWW